MGNKNSSIKVEAAPAPVLVPSKREAEEATPEVEESGTTKTLFVGNLPLNVKRANVEDFFKGAGTVVDVSFIIDADINTSSFCKVDFTTPQEAQKALELNGEFLMGNKLRLYAPIEPPKKSVPVKKRKISSSSDDDSYSSDELDEEISDEDYDDTSDDSSFIDEPAKKAVPGENVQPTLEASGKTKGFND